MRLDQRQAGSTWQPVGPVSPGPGGAVTISAKPRVPTDYRLTSGRSGSTVAHVSVAPLVRFQGMPEAGRLRGYARPVFPGASVALQRFNGSSWRTVARATIDESGFEATLNLVPSDYRARLAPGRGFVPGVSPTLKWDRHEATSACDLPGRVGRARLCLGGRFAIGVEDGADSRAVASGSRRGPAAGCPGSGRSPSPSALRCCLALADNRRRLGRADPGVAPTHVHAERPVRRPSVYLSRIHAFDAWSQVPNLAGVRVAILDSGIDSAHPELQSRIADGGSFVASSWENDTNGHGTFVAGEIAAALNNAQGIAGVGFPAQLLVKIVRSDGTISPDAEAAAIRWAVDNGARVINMSFGGVRDPRDPTATRTRRWRPLPCATPSTRASSWSPLSAMPTCTDGAWGYAGYPAALPHVLGVSAIARTALFELLEPRPPPQRHRGSGRGDLLDAAEALTFGTKPVPAPGLLGLRPGGVPARRGDVVLGSAVAGAAAVLFAVEPSATADQVANALTRSAADADGHRMRSLLDRPRRAHRLGPARRRERGPQAERLTARFGPVRGQRRGVDRRLPVGPQGQRIRATLDYWDDRVDVYKIKLRPRQRLVARLRGPSGTNSNLFSGSPAHSGSAASRPTGGCSRRSRSRPARSSGSG